MWYKLKQVLHCYLMMRPDVNISFNTATCIFINTKVIINKITKNQQKTCQLKEVLVSLLVFNEVTMSSRTLVTSLDDIDIVYFLFDDNPTKILLKK